ncbi:MAG: sigma-70 family RNA polymerase sigma factor [Myxococcales bacterium]|jgi:RNA polymerase primary sigma factor|nr:sigma-70 family RNA polymerase sigma factor [Myxococcales bacterium]
MAKRPKSKSSPTVTSSTADPPSQTTLQPTEDLATELASERTPVPKPRRTRLSPLRVSRKPRKKRTDADPTRLPPAEEAEASAEKSSQKKPGPDLMLSYFKDINRLPVLSPAAEYELARRIGIMEEVLWVQILSLAPLTPHILAILEETLGKAPPESPAVLKAAAELCDAGQSSGKTLSQAAGPLSAKLRQLDLDRVYVGLILDEVRLLDHSRKEGQPSVTASISNEAWQIYVQGNGVVTQLIHRAKEDFVKANLRLVVSIARRFNFGRLPLSDLIQEGNVGLIKAVERFDYRRGYRFSTYASWWIRHAISRGVADKSRVVRLPVHMLAEMHTLLRHKKRLMRELGRTPTDDELATATGLKTDKIAKMDLSLVEDAVSLDREISGHDRRPFVDFLEDESAELSMSERLISEGMLREVQHLLTGLNGIEADILRLRFGFESDQELTFQEIATKYRLSRERIRQIQEQALNRLRRALARKDLI